MDKKRSVSLFGLGVGFALAVLSAGCEKEQTSGGKPEENAEVATEAMADIDSKSGSTVTGTADFKAEGKTVTLTVSIQGATPGRHGIHIHDRGDCSAADASSAGEHWNPFSKAHGRWGGESYHLGDIGNMEIDQTGRGTLTFTTDEWAIGTGGANDIVGKSVVIHANADDFMSQPSGNSGERVGCGVIHKM